MHKTKILPTDRTTNQKPHDFIYYRKGDYYKGDSFVAISASGPNGAVIHYKPQESTDRRLSIDEVYLLDSGGLYLYEKIYIFP